MSIKEEDHVGFWGERCSVPFLAGGTWHVIPAPRQIIGKHQELGLVILYANDVDPGQDMQYATHPAVKVKVSLIRTHPCYSKKKKKTVGKDCQKPTLCGFSMRMLSPRPLKVHLCRR